MTDKELEKQLNDNLKKKSFLKPISLVFFGLFWMISLIYAFNYSFWMHKINNIYFSIPVNYFYFIGILLVSYGILLPLLYVFDRKRLAYEIIITYEESKKIGFDLLNSCCELFYTTKIILYSKAFSHSYDLKYTSGAGKLHNTDRLKVYKNNAFRIKCNAPSFSIEHIDFQISFLSFFLIVYLRKEKKYYVFNSIDIFTEIQSINWIWTEKVPNDSKIVDYTWKYLNKQGGPDKRFNDNYQIPILLFNTLRLTLDKVSIELFFSNSDLKSILMENILKIRSNL